MYWFILFCAFAAGSLITAMIYGRMAIKSALSKLVLLEICLKDADDQRLRRNITATFEDERKLYDNFSLRSYEHDKRKLYPKFYN
jgi:hypothetical protein